MVFYCVYCMQIAKESVYGYKMSKQEVVVVETMLIAKESYYSIAISPCHLEEVDRSEEAFERIVMAEESLLAPKPLPDSVRSLLG